MNIKSIPISYSSPLVNKYLNSFSEVGDLFVHNPDDSLAYQARYETVLRDYGTDRLELVRILREYNEKLGSGAKTGDNLDKLLDPSSAVVITGQQAGVLTGPLYTIYKAITAIQLAAQLTEQLGRPVVPLFWVASEDHDYTEVDHLELLERSQDITRLKLGYTPPGKYSVGHIPTNEAVLDLIELLREKTNPSEWKDEIIENVIHLAKVNDNLADWFAAIMSWLFQKFGLIIVNPLTQGLRRLWSDTFAAFLEKADRVNEKLETAAHKVLALGAKPQVITQENSVNMFLYVEGERLPLFKSGDHFIVRGKNRLWTLAELKEIARERPQDLSPNVVLRPIAQDALMPILAYVAGPGEISYYGLYREIYPLFNQEMPVIFPRVNITLVERGVAKNMDKYGIDFAQGSPGLKVKLDQFLESQDYLGIEALFSEFAGEIKQSFTQLMDKVIQVDADLVKVGTENLGKVLHLVEHLEKKTLQYHRKSCDLAIKNFQSMDNNLFPHRNWQERAFNVFPYLFKYSTEFVERLADLPLLGDHHHKLVYLG